MENTMLIVDDTELNREILSLLFCKKYAVLEAGDGQEALEVLESCMGNIDIILLDLVMPHIDGFKLLKTLKEKEYTKDIPVIVITSSGAVEDQIQAFALGASDYVNKPFVPEVVISRVDNVMESYRKMISIELEAEKLKVKSELDQMTGLINKTTVEVMVDKALRSSGGNLHVMVLIDIDNFKSVNDTAGHLAGDQTIKIVADQIAKLFRKTDIVGRIGGDEFIALMMDIPSMDIARAKVNELVQIMKYKPNLAISDNISLSIGVASNDRKPTCYRELFEKADEALYIAKKSGKARYEEYGYERLELKEDNRPAVLLISSNRNVCSMVHTLMPENVRVVEALDLDVLSRMDPTELAKVMLVYADISKLRGDSSAYWNRLTANAWIEGKKVLAICLEGSMEQYASALQAGTADILSEPLEPVSFKRRTWKHLQEFGIAGI